MRMLLWNKLSKEGVQMEQMKEKGKPSEMNVPMEPMKEKDKPSEKNVLLEPMKEKDKPSEGIVFQRKEPCTVEEKTFQGNIWRKEPCSGGENLPILRMT